ncbi:MAG: cation diffusion facilitator family transporter [Candidatus Thermoplasmatota archaeon]|uniref:Cation transporter n=2 Tax=Candidatus Sysuiplasma superficiale TaxID=2823368 RepID=A0A8J7YKD8_9ARCH|nr:cation transporter [Candidatus Sysuiplasma superficiale]MCL5437239.1 cation diffusion facilitator family transporter [Candidatus Thermoplasmatota archaeon]
MIYHITAKDEMEKEKASKLSVVSNSLLSALKIAIGLLTGSVAVLSDGIHSFTDVAASVSTALSVRTASRPADYVHRFGHGKFENVSGVFESVLLLVTGAIILAESLQRFTTGDRITDVGVAVITMVVSAAADFAISVPVRGAAKRADSAALRVDYVHLATDGVSSLGVIVALLLVYVTGSTLFDIGVALIIAGIMFISGIRLMLESGGPLVDRKISDEDEDIIRKVINEHSGICGYHSLRTRKSGNVCFVDFHLTFRPDVTLYEAHRVTDEIEEELRKYLPNCSTLVHLEPEGAGCTDAHV